MKQYTSCPSSVKLYEADKKSYTVTRYFTGDKDIKSIMYELALSHTDKEIGLE